MLVQIDSSYIDYLESRSRLYEELLKKVKSYKYTTEEGLEMYSADALLNRVSDELDETDLEGFTPELSWLDLPDEEIPFTTEPVQKIIDELQVQLYGGNIPERSDLNNTIDKLFNELYGDRHKTVSDKDFNRLWDALENYHKVMKEVFG